MDPRAPQHGRPSVPSRTRTHVSLVAACDLLATHAPTIGRIQLCFGIDAVTFEEQVLSIIRRLASYVLNLPASRNTYYDQPGGMFQLALDVAFFSLQGTDGHIYAGRSTISIRRHLEPRWRLATFIAGLVCVLERAAGQAVVEDETGSRWPALLMPLESWLEARTAPGYRLSWVDETTDVPGYGLLALPHVVPAETLKYLSEGNEDVLPSLLASIAGLPRYRDHNPLPRLVKRAYALVVHEWAAGLPPNECGTEGQAHLRRYLLDAMRKLAACHPHWVPNRDKSRLWIGRDGLYLVWPQSAADIIVCFDEDELAGMPRSPESMLELLESASVLETRPGSLGHLWHIHPPASPGPLEAVKLVSSGVLYRSGVEPPTPLDTTLAVRSANPDRAPPGAASPSGEQLSLTIGGPAAMGRTQPSSVEPAQKHDASGDAPGRRPNIVLKSPLKLDRSVQAVLEELVNHWNTTGLGAVRSPEGLFVPMNSLQAHNMEPALAIRAMDRTEMLERDSRGRPRISKRTIEGQALMGVLIRPTFLDDSPPAD